MTESKLNPLDEVNRLIREGRVDDYISPNRALGMHPVAFGPATSHWRWTEQPALALNPFGLIQGGYLAVFVDELFSTAIGSVLEVGEFSVTAEAKLSYLRAIRPGMIEGAAKVIRRGVALAFLEAEITTADGKPAVRATSTWAITRADSSRNPG